MFQQEAESYLSSGVNGDLHGEQEVNVETGLVRGLVVADPCLDNIPGIQVPAY